MSNGWIVVSLWHFVTLRRQEAAVAPLLTLTPPDPQAATGRAIEEPKTVGGDNLDP